MTSPPHDEPSRHDPAGDGPQVPPGLEHLPDEVIADREEAYDEDFEASAPLLGTWKRWYAIVLGNLVLLMILFFLFTRAFD